MRLKLYLITIIFHAVLPAFSAVGPPDLHCISVDDNGNVILDWTPPNDPLNEFVRYEVYFSQNQNNGYATTNVTGLATTTIQHNNTANLNSYYYFIQTVYNDGSGNANSVSSDTLQTILPFFNNQTDTTADVRWNPIHVPDNTGSSGMYRIYRKLGSSGNWQRASLKWSGCLGATHARKWKPGRCAEASHPFGFMHRHWMY